MRLAASLKDDAELERCTRFLTRDSSDTQAPAPRAWPLYERAQMLESARRNAPTCRRAASPLLDRSLATHADDPEAVWAFAMQAADLKRNLDVALQRLVPMFKRLPSNPDMALAAGRVLYVRGDQNLAPYAMRCCAMRTPSSETLAAERITELKKKLGDAKAN